MKLVKGNITRVIKDKTKLYPRNRNEIASIGFEIDPLPNNAGFRITYEIPVMGFLKEADRVNRLRDMLRAVQSVWPQAQIDPRFPGAIVINAVPASGA